MSRTEDLFEFCMRNYICILYVLNWDLLYYRGEDIMEVGTQYRKHGPSIICTSYQEILSSSKLEFVLQVIGCTSTQSVEHMVIPFSFTLMTHSRFLQQIMRDKTSNNYHLQHEFHIIQLPLFQLLELFLSF